MTGGHDNFFFPREMCGIKASRHSTYGNYNIGEKGHLSKGNLHQK